MVLSQKGRFGDMAELQLFISFLSLLVLLAIFQKGFREKTTYLGNLQQFKPKDDVTTVVPLSVHAATCDHNWEKITEQVLDMPHEKKVVLVLNCRNCGIIDKTVQTTSPSPKNREIAIIIGKSKSQ